jgi:hypothetical protein
MAKAIRERPNLFADNFPWLADIQEQAKESLYIDCCHYNNKFSQEIARHIGQFLIERKLLGAEPRQNSGR